MSVTTPSMSSKSFYSLHSVADVNSNVFAQLLEIDTYKILINIGSDPHLNINYKNEIDKIIDDVDCLIISHADLKYIGGLPYIGKRFKGKIYCSIPVQVLGKNMISEVNKNLKIHGLEVYDEKDIDNVFNSIDVVKYSQPIEIDALKITAFNSGYSLGGSIWQITKDNENVVVAFDINHRRENHIDGLEINNIKKSHILLLNCDFIDKVAVNRKARDAEFISFLEHNINSKIVIICNFSRYLEICCVLDEFLENKNKKCVLLSFNAEDLYENIKVMLEWAGDIVLKKFTSTKVNPFMFRNIKFVELYSEIDNKTDIFVILDENFSSVFTHRVIHDFNDKENVLICFNEKYGHMARKMNNINLPTFCLKVEDTYKSKEDILSEQKQSTGNNSASHKKKSGLHRIRIAEHAKHCDINEITFPIKDKQRPHDSYGEFFDQKLFSMATEKKEVEEVVEKPMAKKNIENITVNNIPFTFKMRVRVFDFNGLSDGNSMKSILESLEIEKIILFGNNRMFTELFYHICYYNKNFRKVFIMENKTLNLSTDVTITKINLDENFLQKANLEKIHDREMASFKGHIKDNTLYYKAPLNEQFCLGNIKLPELKKQLLECNLKVKNIDDKLLIVEENIVIDFYDDAIRLIGKMNGLYLYVRKVIYKNICFIN